MRHYHWIILSGFVATIGGILAGPFGPFYWMQTVGTAQGMISAGAAGLGIAAILAGFRERADAAFAPQYRPMTRAERQRLREIQQTWPNSLESQRQEAIKTLLEGAKKDAS